MQSEMFLSKENLSWEGVGEGIQRQIMGYDDNIMMVKVAFTAGSIGYEHKHPHVQTTYVESGTFDFTIDGIKKRVTAGDALLMPPNTLHSAVCIEAGVLIDVFSPIREDFLS